MKSDNMSIFYFLMEIVSVSYLYILRIVREMCNCYLLGFKMYKYKISTHYIDT